MKNLGAGGVDAEWMNGHRHLRVGGGHGGLDVVPGQGIKKRLNDLGLCARQGRTAGHRRTLLDVAAHAAWRAGASSFLMTASATASVDPGFCPVMRFRSTTTWEIHAAGPSSNTAPAFFRATSSSHAMPSSPASVWSSSSSVKLVSR